MNGWRSRALVLAWTASGALVASTTVPLGAPTLLALACLGATLALACVVPTPRIRLSEGKRRAALCVLLALAPVAAAHVVFAGITVFSRL